jgi:hypothetical protein
MNIWHNRWALGTALLILGAGSLQGCTYPTNGYPGYPAYAGYGYPAYGNYGYPAYGDYGGGVVIGGGLNGGYDHGHDWGRRDHDDHQGRGDRPSGQATGFRADHHDGANRPAAQSGFRAAVQSSVHPEPSRGATHHGDDRPGH